MKSILGAIYSIYIYICIHTYIHPPISLFIIYVYICLCMYIYAHIKRETDERERELYDQLDECFVFMPLKKKADE